MNNSTNQLIDLDYTRLPPAPHVLIKLIDLFHQTEVSFEELEAIIEKDTALCAKVISISNSAAYSQWSDVRELKRILVVLGTKTIKSIALTSAVHQFFSAFSKELGETLGSIWLDALICAHLSRLLANLTGYDNPDEAHLAGIMHQLGQLVFISNDPQKYQSIMASVSEQSILLLKEQEIFGIQSNDLAADIISKWGVDSFLHDAVRYQHKSATLVQDAHPLVKLINLSSQLCNRLNHSNNKYLVEDHFFGLNQSVIDNMVQQATQLAVAEATSFGVEVNEDPALPLANIDDESIRMELARRVRQIALLEGVQKDISALSDILDMIKIVNENLQLLFGFSNTIFFFPDSQESTLTGIASHSKNAPVNGSFSITLKSGCSLVSEAALQQTLVDSYHQTFFDEIPVIDHQVQTSLLFPHFICLPLINQKQLMGVIAIGCETLKAERIHTDNDLLNHFATIIAESFAHHQQTTHEQQQLQQQKRQEIDLQTRKVIHEVNNPLTIIINYLEILSLDIEKDSQNKKHIEIIKSEVDRVSEILLQLNDKQFQEQDEHFEVDVNQLINKLITLFKPTFYKLNHIQNQLDLDPKLPLVSTNQNKLKQILTNLLKNAAEALPDKGSITVKTRALLIVNRKKYIGITISDNGEGVPEAIIEKLFSPVETTKGANHSGLGLTIVNKLVSELKGSISYSTSDLGGAEFTLLLPRN